MTETDATTLERDQLMLLLRLMAAQMAEMAEKVDLAVDLMQTAIDEIVSMGADLADNQD